MSVVLQFSDHTKQHCRNKRSMIIPEAWTPVIINTSIYYIYIHSLWQKRKDVAIDLLKPDLIMWSLTVMQSWTAIVNVIRLSELRNKTFLFSSPARRALTLLQFRFSQLNHSWCKDFWKLAHSRLFDVGQCWFLFPPQNQSPRGEHMLPFACTRAYLAGTKFNVIRRPLCR